eukprot:m.2224 g.2224  ORF g.2224 m.2224 type:complete len:303 (-) comp1738_c1_seq1:277-1185(-)
MMMMLIIIFTGLCLSLFLCDDSIAARVNSVEYRSDKDTTICQSEDMSTSMSNARGDGLYIGTISLGLNRRSLVYFDVSDLRNDISSTNEIESASFILYERRINWPKDSEITVHRILEPWNEGMSSAVGGKCADSTADDASWTLRRVGDNSTWSGGPGGSFDPIPSATIQVASGGEEYLWTGDGLLRDVREWVNRTAPNYGWIVIGDESSEQTAKSFGSREFADETKWPHLILELTSPANKGSRVVHDVVVPIVVTILVLVGLAIMLHMYLRYKRHSATAPIRSVYNQGTILESFDHDDDENM